MLQAAMSRVVNFSRSWSKKALIATPSDIYGLIIDEVLTGLYPDWEIDQTAYLNQAKALLKKSLEPYNIIFIHTRLKINQFEDGVASEQNLDFLGDLPPNILERVVITTSLEQELTSRILSPENMEKIGENRIWSPLHSLPQELQAIVRDICDIPEAQGRLEPSTLEQ